MVVVLSHVTYLTFIGDSAYEEVIFNKEERVLDVLSTSQEGVIGGQTKKWALSDYMNRKSSYKIKDTWRSEGTGGWPQHEDANCLRERPGQ